MLLLVAAVVLFELAAQALRIAFWPQDEDVWRVVESMGGVVGGAGMGGDTGREGVGGGEVGARAGQGEGEDEAERREREVGDLLRRRGDDGSGGSGGGGEGVDGGAVERMLSRGFGEVKTVKTT